MYIGGHCIIEKSLADRYFKSILAPSTTVKSYSDGFIDINALKQLQKNRAVEAKLRVRVFKRDKYKCKMCGRSPQDRTDVEIHAHHIIPWGEGGVTDVDNLITLCHTCHKGLYPHHDPEPYNFFRKGNFRKRSFKKRKLYRQTETTFLQCFT